MHPGVLSDLGRLKGLVIVLDSRVLWQERSTGKPLGRRWHWVLRFRSAERMLLRAVPKGRNLLSLLLFYLVPGMEPGAYVRETSSILPLSYIHGPCDFSGSSLSIALVLMSAEAV